MSARSAPPEPALVGADLVKIPLNAYCPDALPLASLPAARYGDGVEAPALRLWRPAGISDDAGGGSCRDARTKNELLFSATLDCMKIAGGDVRELRE